MILASWLKTALGAAWILWVSTLVVSRVYIFCEAYSLESIKVQDEKYLLEKCKDPEFFYNLKQHTDLCASVIANANTSILLKSLNAVATNTHACGAKPCSEIMQALVSKFTWHAAAALCLMAIVFPNAILLLLRAAALARGRSAVRVSEERFQRHGPLCLLDDLHASDPWVGAEHRRYGSSSSSSKGLLLLAGSPLPLDRGGCTVLDLQGEGGDDWEEPREKRQLDAQLEAGEEGGLIPARTTVKQGGYVDWDPFQLRHRKGQSTLSH